MNQRQGFGTPTTRGRGDLGIRKTISIMGTGVGIRATGNGGGRVRKEFFFFDSSFDCTQGGYKEMSSIFADQ